MHCYYFYIIFLAFFSQFSAWNLLYYHHKVDSCEDHLYSAFYHRGENQGVARLNALLSIPKPVRQDSKLLSDGRVHEYMQRMDTELPRGVYSCITLISINLFQLKLCFSCFNCILHEAWVISIK